MRHVRQALPWAAAGVGALVLIWLYYRIPALLLHDAKDAETFRGQLTTLIGICNATALAAFTINKHFLDREKQRTDIFNGAIAHLASADPVIRAGGVRALNRMMTYSTEDRHRVLETLADLLRRSNDLRPGQNPNHNVPSDIAAILIALRERRVRDGDPALDLGGIRLPGTALHDIDLQGAHMTSADLTRADLRRTVLRDADLEHATLVNADLTGADLRGARLHRARLVGAVLTTVNLSGADFTEAALTGADLRGTDLREAIGLTSEHIDSAHTDSTTILPDHLR